MNNNVPQEKKDSVLKSLAIAGFIGIIILIAWASIQFVSILPGAFGSLASLAEGLNQYKETVLEDTDYSVVSLTVTSNATLVNTGQSVVISWDTAQTAGTYTFTYSCSDGVAVDILNVGGIQSIACDTNYNVGNVNSLSIAVDSEKNRFIELDYTIAFIKTNDVEPSAVGKDSVTIVNNDIANLFVDETTVEAEVVEETSVETENVILTENTTEPTETFKQEFVYTIPISDPDGHTDMSTRFISIGNIVGATYFKGEVEQDDKGAIQFEIKNYGTRTSAKWTFTLNLPNGGSYESKEQVPLKPNERATLTIGFSTIDNSAHTFKITIDEATDVNLSNDQFTQAVTFVK